MRQVGNYVQANPTFPHTSLPFHSLPLSFRAAAAKNLGSHIDNSRIDTLNSILASVGSK